MNTARDLFPDLRLSQKRYDGLTAAKEMTLDQKLTPEWYQILFEKDYTTQEWDKILRVAERASPRDLLGS